VSSIGIAIVGTGVGGLTAALSLHAAGFEDVVLLEAKFAMLALA